ncbi:MAG: hypothetical protein DPW11_01950 [bacterium]|nr:hypothetical protein [Candidatus Microgenomates bacterium CPR3]MCQ3944521.1 hypothetical protein [bacterium]RIK51079.1 MAG: hypothetical protein DCC61_03795 [Candidatus Microgenomates bacterium]
MLPILLKLGPITIYSYGVFLAMGLFAGLYWFWKMGRDEHWEETWIFDTYFVATFTYLIVGRVAYVLLNPELYSFSRALSILAYPGISAVSGIVATLLVILFLSRKAEIDFWKVMDAWVVVLMIVMVITSVGSIFNGSMPGLESSSFGYVHPGDNVPRLSGDLWTFIWSLLTFGVVSKVRKNFRFYSWYKGEASVARDGLAGLVLLALSGLYACVLGFMLEGQRIWLIPRTTIIGILVLFISLVLIYFRSGKNKKKG